MNTKKRTKVSKMIAITIELALKRAKLNEDEVMSQTK